MTTTSVGMRCPECSRERTVVKTLRNSARHPQVTLALIAINVVAFLTEQGQFTLFGSTIHGTVIDEGVLYRAGIGEGHQYWRLISSAFLHENFIHIGFNMYLLYLLGMMLEPAIGSVRFFTIYFTALLAGSFGALFATASPSLGASGAIFGLMGAAVVELRARRISVMESGIGGLIVAVNASAYFSRPGPRLIDGLELLAQILHPECVAEMPLAGKALAVELSASVGGDAR
jgi:membrane associated rhomboid family serine protease